VSLRQPVQQDQRLGQVVHGADDLRMFRRQYLAAQRQHRLGQFTRLLKVPLLDQDSDLNAHRRERVGVFLSQRLAVVGQRLVVEIPGLLQIPQVRQRVGQVGSGQQCQRMLRRRCASASSPSFRASSSFPRW